jgi:hypothetical protein
MNPQRDEELLRRYREASGELDERPAVSARAAILAAAAREIGARPVDAAKVAPRPRMRWPWAAAAAVMLSTLAVLLATRTEQEQPSFTPPAEPARETAREPAAAQPMTPAESAAPSIAESKPAPPAAESRRSAAAESKVSAGSAPSAPAPLRKENRQLAAAEEPPVARAKTEGTAEADVGDARSRAPTPPPAASPPPPPPPSASSTAEAAAGTVGSLQAPAAEQQARIAERSQSRSDSAVRPQVKAAKPRAEAADAANEIEREGVEQRPEDWLQKIIRLRLDGRHDEAEAELKRFRDRYPQWQVPPAALGPSGTR